MTTDYYAPPRYTMKQGDTLDLSGIALDGNDEVEPMTDWTGQSQIRLPDGTLLEELTFVWLDAELAAYRIYSTNNTIAWPVGRAQFDIQLTTPEGQLFSSPTVEVTITGDVTR